HPIGAWQRLSHRTRAIADTGPCPVLAGAGEFEAGQAISTTYQRRFNAVSNPTTVCAKTAWLSPTYSPATTPPPWGPAPRFASSWPGRWARAQRGPAWASGPPSVAQRGTRG